MPSGACRSRLCVWGITCAIQVLAAEGMLTPFLPQSFFFDWNLPGQPVPIPTTEQCDTIHITWQRGTATGPNPVAPYYLQVYTSTSEVPFVIPAGDGLTFDWDVPFAPGTIYQICMFDKNGNTGGCQAAYTVIPPRQPPTCTNVTFPAALDVVAEVDNGPMSQYGWIDQCTDLSVTPQGGTPPYTLTVAPSLHPPYNISSSDGKGLNWTVSLSWASQFFVSVVDSDGSMWSNGPLHSGGGGDTACLAGIESSNDPVIKPIIPIVSGVGGLIVGLLFGAIIAYIVMHCLNKQQSRRRGSYMAAAVEPYDTAYDPIMGGSHASSQNRAPSATGTQLTHHPSLLLGRMGTDRAPYQIEPLVMPNEEGRLVPDATRPPTSQSPPTNFYTPLHAGSGQNQPAPGLPVQTYPNAPRPGGHLSPTGPTVPGSPPTQLLPQPPPGAAVEARPPSNVYVLHHDSNFPPVTIFHHEGTRIVELPPRYPTRAPDSGSGAPGTGPANTNTNADNLLTDNRSDSDTTGTDPTTILSQDRIPAPINKKPRTQFTGVHS